MSQPWVAHEMFFATTKVPISNASSERLPLIAVAVLPPWATWAVIRLGAGRSRRALRCRWRMLGMSEG
jgi:hypothetical protein